MSLSWYRMRFYHCPVPSVETAHGFDYPEPERNFIEFARSQVALGDPQQARARLEQFAAEFTTDELLLLTVAYDFATRVRSYKLIADEFGLERSAAGATPEKQSASISSSRPHVRRRRVP